MQNTARVSSLPSIRVFLIECMLSHLATTDVYLA